MKRQDFITQLRIELYGLPSSEIEDIIRDHNEMFDDALAAGRTENDVVASFGSPKDLANSLKAEIKIDQAKDEKKLSKQVSGAFGAVAALLVLAPFNLIFVLGPFAALIGILCAGWGIAISSVAGSFAFLGLFMASLVLVGGSAWIYIALFFTCLGCLGLAALFLVAMYNVTRFFLQLTLSYLKWNLNFIKARA